MAAIITPTGQDVISIAGSNTTYVGRFTAADIDQDIVDNTPYSEPEVAELWIRDKIIAIGLDPDALTDLEAAYGNRAMLWRIWLYYFELSRTGENCPEECKNNDLFWPKFHRVCRLICENLNLLGLTDDKYCKAKPGTEAKGLAVFGFNTRSNCD